MRRLLATLALAAVGCAPTLPESFVRAMAAGDRAAHAGRSAEAIERYDHAAREARRPHDRDEAEYRAAMALARTDVSAALQRLDLLATRSPDFERGARAAFEAALLRCDDVTTRERGRADLDALVRRRPATGPARRALAHLLADDDRDAALARIGSLLAEARVTATPLRETLLAERARRLADAGRHPEAVAAWRSLFTTIPYPQNSHWDDGHLRLAELLRADGDPRGAVAALDEMLSVRDPSCTGGSCDAPMFQEGAMLRGEILRDDLREPARAAEAFHRAYEMFTTSVVRDDALEAEVRVVESMRDPRACELWVRLATEFPCTRRGRGARERASACGGRVPPTAEGACE